MLSGTASMYMRFRQVRCREARCLTSYKNTNWELYLSVERVCGAGWTLWSTQVVECKVCDVDIRPTLTC